MLCIYHCLKMHFHLRTVQLYDPLVHLNERVLVNCIFWLLGSHKLTASEKRWIDFSVRRFTLSKMEVLHSISICSLHSKCLIFVTYLVPVLAERKMWISGIENPACHSRGKLMAGGDGVVYRYWYVMPSKKISPWRVVFSYITGFVIWSILTLIWPLTSCHTC